MLLNLLLSMVWFASLVLMVVGVFWALVAFAALIEGGIAIYVILKGHSPVGVAGPLLGLAVSLCNFNMVSGTLELFAMGLMIVSLMGREEEAPEA